MFLKIHTFWFFWLCFKFFINEWNRSSLALSKFPIPPVTVLIESLTENIGLSQVDTSIAQVMRETNWGKSLVDIGKGYIPNSCSPLGKKIIHI